ncbi:hypothetical protein [Kitasatospora sp. NPDC056184]|uniref:hypothetical protein n=1 Tax=Kitasatospora sp. NPDC056184 TaxID=3345738 RepID=UPI0035D711EA
MTTASAAVPTPEAITALLDVLDVVDAQAVRRAFEAERPGPLPDHWWPAVPGATYEEAFAAPGLVAERLSAACGRAQVYFQDPFADPAVRAAAGLPVNPAAITAGTPVRGHGRPAPTAPGAGHHGFGGAPVL